MLPTQPVMYVLSEINQCNKYQQSISTLYVNIKIPFLEVNIKYFEDENVKCQC